MPTTAPHAVAMRWISVALLAGSLLALAAVPGAGGLAAAAVMWIVAFALFERAKGLRASP